jgi:hypothetical protein
MSMAGHEQTPPSEKTLIIKRRVERPLEHLSKFEEEKKKNENFVVSLFHFLLLDWNLFLTR